MSLLLKEGEECKIKNKLCEEIFSLAEVYRGYCQKCLNEEERAEKQIEHSYLMLHLYWRGGSQEEEYGKEDTVNKKSEEDI